MSPMTKLPLGMEHALLGLLRAQPMHAYEMHQTLTQVGSLGLVWHLKQSQLYALLARLEQASYITGAIEQQGSRPPRRMLHLTPAGNAAFEHWLATPVEHGRDFRLEFLARLFFSAREGPEHTTRLIAVQRDLCATWLADLSRQAQAAEPNPYDWLVLQFRIGQIEAIMQWLDTCATRLVPVEDL